jgi:hypothetical protein
MWENTSYRMAEEQRRRNASRRKHVDAGGQAGPAPRMVSHAGGVDVTSADIASIASACGRHGLAPQPWVQPRTVLAPRRPRVFDVMLLEGPEVELLEVRLHELSGSVDRFILVEGRRTAHGRRKPTFFAEHRDTPRFAPYRQKLVHYEVPEAAYKQKGRELLSSEVDRLHRTEMRRALREAGVQPGDVVLAGSVNEIPSAASLGLFIGCTGWPSNATTVGLLLEPFVFSFELGGGSSGSSGAMPRVSLYSEERQEVAFSRSSIGRAESGGGGPVLLTDAGWTCTCCFASLADYIDHCSDLLTVSRFGASANRRDSHVVQRVLCGGKPDATVASTGRPHVSAQQLRGGGGGPSSMDQLPSGVAHTAAPPLKRHHGTSGVPSWLGEEVAAAAKGEGSSGGSNDVAATAAAAAFLLPGHCQRVAVAAPTAAATQLKGDPPPPPPPPPLPPPSVAAQTSTDTGTDAAAEPATQQMGASTAAHPRPAGEDQLQKKLKQLEEGGDPAIRAAVSANTQKEVARAAKYTALRTEAGDVSDPASAGVSAKAGGGETLEGARPLPPPQSSAVAAAATATQSVDVVPSAPTAAPPIAISESAARTTAAISESATPGSAEAAAAAEEARKHLVKKGHGRDR